MTFLRRRLLGLLVTLVLGAGAVALVYWQSEKSERTDKQAEEAKKVLAFSEVSSAKQLELLTPAGTFVMVREGTASGTDAWRLTSPLATRADAVMVSGLLKALVNLKSTVTLGERDKSQIKDKKLFGLQPARFRVTITTSQGKKETLLAGNKNSFNGTLYVQREGEDEVLMVPSALEYELDQTLFKLRDKHLVDVTLDEVQKLDIAPLGKPAFSLQRKGSDAWKLLAGRELTAGSDQVNALFSDLSVAVASAIFSEKADASTLVKAGLNKPQATLTITQRQGAPQKMLFSEVTRDGAKKYYATVVGAGPVLELPSNATLERLRGDAQGFRDLKLLTFNRDEVATLELNGGGKTLTFSRTSKDGVDVWRGLAPQAMDADAPTLSGLIYRLSNLKVTRIERDNATTNDLQRYGLDRPTLRVTLKKGDGVALATVLFGKTMGEEQYLTVEASQRVDVVSATLAGDFSLDPSTYKDSTKTPAP